MMIPRLLNQNSGPPGIQPGYQPEAISIAKKIEKIKKKTKGSK